MDSHTLLHEFKRLMKENKKQYIGITTVLFGALLAVLVLPLILNALATATDSTELSQEEKANPAVFEIYIENETGNSFTNTLLLEQLMKTSELIEGAEQATGIEISDLLDYEKEINYPKTARDRGVLGASRDESSNIWVIVSNMGTTEEENLAITSYYYDLFADKQLELLQNKSSIIISQPRVLTDEELLSPTTLVEQDSSGVFSVKTLIVSLVLALVGAVILGFILILFKSFFSTKIHYAFNYSWSEEDLFVRSSKSNPTGLHQVLTMPAQSHKLYLAQYPEQFELSDVNILPSITAYEGETEFDEIVLLVQPHLTEKGWYNEQRELLKIYRLPLKIIQVND